MHDLRDGSRRTLPVAIAGLALVAVVVAACSTAGAGNGPDNSPSPSSPVATPTPVPTPAPSDAPISPTPSQPGTVRVPLDIATDHDVAVVIDDPSGVVTAAESGTPGDGMSVRWFTAQVRNVDPSTIEVTWVGLPLDDEIALGVSGGAGAIGLHFTQKAPPVDSDATGFDRVLILRFAEPVSADDVTVEFEAAAA
jgi:hypothetical protein